MVIKYGASGHKLIVDDCNLRRLSRQSALEEMISKIQQGDYSSNSSFVLLQFSYLEGDLPRDFSPPNIYSNEVPQGTVYITPKDIFTLVEVPLENVSEVLNHDPLGQYQGLKVFYFDPKDMTWGGKPEVKNNMLQFPQVGEKVRSDLNYLKLKRAA